MRVVRNRVCANADDLHREISAIRVPNVTALDGAASVQLLDDLLLDTAIYELRNDGSIGSRDDTPERVIAVDDLVVGVLSIATHVLEPIETVVSQHMRRRIPA